MVEVVEEDVESGRMEQVELLFLTGNYVEEAMHYQGNFSYKDFF